IFDITKAGSGQVWPGRQRTVGGILTGGDGVADEFDVLGVLLCCKELATLCEMDTGNLDSAAPVADAEFKGGWIRGRGGMGTGGDKGVSGGGVDVCGFPV